MWDQCWEWPLATIWLTNYSSNSRPRHGKQSYPEGRLPLVIAGAFLLPFTVLLYGWTPQLHWPAWVLLLAVVVCCPRLHLQQVLLSYPKPTSRRYNTPDQPAKIPFLQIQGYSIVVAMVPALTYVTDSFGLFSASAITAVLVTRCLAGTFLPLITAPLTGRIGYGWGFTVLAGGSLALALIPVSSRVRVVLLSCFLELTGTRSLSLCVMAQSGGSGLRIAAITRMSEEMFKTKLDSIRFANAFVAGYHTNLALAIGGKLILPFSSVQAQTRSTSTMSTKLNTRLPPKMMA